MTLGRFVWKNAFRNKRRTGLTMLSIGFSLFLLTTLLTFMKILLNPVVEDEAALRLVTSRTTSLADMLPISYLDKIKRVPHVKYAAPLQWFNGLYKDPDYMFANFGTDPALIFEIYSEQKLPPEQKAAFINTKSGAVIGEDLAKRFDLKLGDKITLMGTIFPIDLDLIIVGIFQNKTAQNMLYFNYDYLNEAMGKLNQVGAFTIRADSANAVPEVCSSIDTMFRNSPAETKTETEKAFVLGFVSMLGNIQVIIGSIAGVVVFTMLLVAISTMAMTVRERIREVAILKTMGFQRKSILRLVIAESLFISLFGTGIGMFLGELLRLVNMDQATQGFIQRYDPSLETYLAVLGSGFAIGIISGFFPAWQAANMTITAAMKRVE